MQTPEIRPVALTEQIRTAASQFVSSNFGDRLSIGTPVPVTGEEPNRWLVPIQIEAGSAKRQVGEIKVDAATNEIIDPPRKDELHLRVQTALSQTK